MSYFLSQEKFSHALLVDSDIKFSPDQFFRLLDFDADFTAAAYPNRRVTRPVFRGAMQEAKVTTDLEPRELLARSMRYIVTTSTGLGKSV